MEPFIQGGFTAVMEKSTDVEADIILHSPLQ
jgi:hypothetical protein